MAAAPCVSEPPHAFRYNQGKHVVEVAHGNARRIRRKTLNYELDETIPTLLAKGECPLFLRQPPDLDFDVHACKWVERKAKREVRKQQLDPQEKGQSRSQRAGVGWLWKGLAQQAGGVGVGLAEQPEAKVCLC